MVCSSIDRQATESGNKQINVIHIVRAKAMRSCLIVLFDFWECILLKFLLQSKFLNWNVILLLLYFILLSFY